MVEPEIARRCLSCGASVRQRATFCPQCGQLIGEKQLDSESEYQTNAVEGSETQIIVHPTADGSETQIIVPPESEGPETQIIVLPESDGPETQIIVSPESGGPPTQIIVPPEYERPETQITVPPESDGAETRIIVPSESEGPETQIIVLPEFDGPETQIITAPSQIPPIAPEVSDASAMTQTELVLPEEPRANPAPRVAETQPLIRQTIQREPTVSEADAITPHPANVPRPGMEHHLMDRVDRIRKVSSVVIDQAAYDPSLRFLLVTAVLFILFVILMVLSKVIG